MKRSIYNSIIPIGNKHTILYNSFSGNFVIVKNRLVGFEDLSIENLGDLSPRFYKQLIDAGILIKNNTDEIALLKQRIENADNNVKEYILHINPTLDCNFNCWYCYENHIAYSKMSDEVLFSTLQYITSVIENNQILEHFELGFFGGEPLFYFKDIAKKLILHTWSLCEKSGKKLHIHFTSNGALLNDDIITFLSQFSCGFQITLDGGKLFHDKTRFSKNNKGSFDIIVNNIHRLITAHINVIVRVNYTSENVDSLDSIYENFKSLKNKQFIQFDFQRVWQDKCNEMDETEEKIKLYRTKFRKEGFTVLANYIPHDVRNSCYGDKINHVLINYNGDVYGCTARDFTRDNRVGYLDSHGYIHYNTEILNIRNKSKMFKPVCRVCRIAPICGGGCKQRALESINDESCTLNYSEEDIDNIIKNIFEYSFKLNTL